MTTGTDNVEIISSPSKASVTDRLMFSAWGSLVAFTTAFVIRRLNARKDREGLVKTSRLRVVGPDGDVWHESDDELEIHVNLEPGYRVERLYAKTIGEWRDA